MSNPPPHTPAGPPGDDDLPGTLARIDERARRGEISAAEREVQRAESVTLAGGHPSISSLEQEISERLAALDHLYATGQISADELGEARRRILSASDAAPRSAPTRVTASPPPAPPSPPAGDGAVGGGTPEPGSRKVAGLPAWAVAVIAAVVIVGAVAIALVLVVGGGDDDTAEPPADPPSAAQQYAASIRSPLDQLTASAVATSRALGRVSEPDEIPAFNAAVERQLDLVESARRRLAQVAVGAADEPAHDALVEAATTQRRYLVQLSRASAGEPDQASLTATNRARAAGAQTIRAYRAFFALAPEAPDAITTTDLTDTAGLRSAIQKGIAEQEAPASPAPSPAPTPTPAPAPAPGVYGGPSFQSPTGNLRCQVSGATLFCSSSNDGFGVALPDFGPPSTGSGIASGGVTVPYGSSWANGVFRCDSASSGITCRNGSGNGFFLNRDRYDPF